MIGVAHVEDMRVSVVIHADSTAMCSADWEDRTVGRYAGVAPDMRAHEQDGVHEINWLLAASVSRQIIFGQRLPRMFP